MKEVEPERFRDFTVCYNDYRNVSHYNLEETEKMVLGEDVRWIVHHGQHLDEQDVKIYKIYLLLKEKMEGEGSPSNKDIVEAYNEGRWLENCISRKTVSDVRKKIARTMGFKGGW